MSPELGQYISEAGVENPEWLGVNYKQDEALIIQRNNRLIRYEDTRLFTPAEARGNTRVDRIRLNEDYQRLRSFFGDDLDKLTGQTVIVPYWDAGYGHRNQAFEIADQLSSMLGVHTVMTSPTANINPADAMFHEMKRVIHKALQASENGGAVDLLKEFQTSIADKPLRDKRLKRIQDKVVQKIGKFLLTLLSAQIDDMNSVPAEDNCNETLISRFMKRCESDPNLANRILRMFLFLDSQLTERSLASNILELVKETNACAVVTSHSTTVRAMGPVMEAKHIGRRPLTVIAATPDNGYVMQSPYTEDMFEAGENGGITDQIKDGMLLEPFASHRGAARIIHAVADQAVADSMHRRYGIPEKQIYTVGTICNSITPEQFYNKWNATERRILLSVNGNASNTKQMRTMLTELATRDQSWREKNYKIKIFLADHTEEVESFETLLEEHNLSDCVDLIVTSKACKSETAEARELLQQWAHVEIRTPGENILVGANDGVCEVGLPAGCAFNENENMFFKAKSGEALCCPYPPETHEYWRKDLEARRIKPEHYEQYGLNTEPIQTASDFLDYLFEPGKDGKSKAYKTARRGYENGEKEAVFRIAAILAFDVLKPKGITREQLKQMLEDSSRERREALQRKIDELYNTPC